MIDFTEYNKQFNAYIESKKKCLNCKHLNYENSRRSCKCSLLDNILLENAVETICDGFEFSDRALERFKTNFNSDIVKLKYNFRNIK